MAQREALSVDAVLTDLGQRFGNQEAARMLRAALFADDFKEARPLGNQLVRLMLSAASTRDGIPH